MVWTDTYRYRYSLYIIHIYEDQTKMVTWDNGISTNRFLLDQYVRIPQLILLKSFFYFIFLFPIPTLLILNTGNSGPYEKFCIGNNSGIRTFHLVTSFSDYPIKWSPTNFKHVLLHENIFTLSAFSCCPDWSPPTPDANGGDVKMSIRSNHLHFWPHN